MSTSAPLRILVCDPKKNSRDQLCRFLSHNPSVADVIPARSLRPLKERLATGKINVLFIDPLSLDLAAASNLIFQIRKELPAVVICLFVDSCAIRRQSAEFYEGERGRFGHYYRLNKELTGSSFDEAAWLLLSHCVSAVHRWQLRPRRIQLINTACSLDFGSRPVRQVKKEAAPVLQNTIRTAPARLQPVELLISSMSGIKSVAKFFSRI